MDKLEAAAGCLFSTQLFSIFTTSTAITPPSPMQEATRLQNLQHQIKPPHQTNSNGRLQKQQLKKMNRSKPQTDDEPPKKASIRTGSEGIQVSRSKFSMKSRRKKHRSRRLTTSSTLRRRTPSSWRSDWKPSIRSKALSERSRPAGVQKETFSPSPVEAKGELK